MRHKAIALLLAILILAACNSAASPTLQPSTRQTIATDEITKAAIALHDAEEAARVERERIEAERLQAEADQLANAAAFDPLHVTATAQALDEAAVDLIERRIELDDRRQWLGVTQTLVADEVVRRTNEAGAQSQFWSLIWALPIVACVAIILIGIVIGLLHANVIRQKAAAEAAIKEKAEAEARVVGAKADYQDAQTFSQGLINLDDRVIHVRAPTFEEVDRGEVKAIITVIYIGPRPGPSEINGQPIIDGDKDRTFKLNRRDGSSEVLAVDKDRALIEFVIGFLRACAQVSGSSGKTIPRWERLEKPWKSARRWTKATKALGDTLLITGDGSITNHDMGYKNLRQLIRGIQTRSITLLHSTAPAEVDSQNV